MPGLLENVDPDGLLEYSVVYSDRSLNHMSQSFRSVMKGISDKLKQVYHADAAVVVPGSGTFGMEAVARQFADGKKCLVIRNGFFSFRWSQIFEMARLPENEIVIKAKQVADETQSPFCPPAIAEVVAKIQSEQPDVVFAPHVETSAGMILPDEYIKAVGEAVHQHGGLFVLDCIASGAVWVNMKELGVDVVLSAPQKGWSGSPCCGLVMMSNKAVEKMDQTTSTSFACDLKKWHQIMQAYEQGGHAYHCTMPTDSLVRFESIMNEVMSIGLDKIQEQQWALGKSVRELLESAGFPSVAGDGFKAPGVVVSYTSDPDIKSGSKFAAAGVQVAGGVPLMCDERDDFQSFRIGLFGIEKLQNPQRTVDNLKNALTQL